MPTDDTGRLCSRSDDDFDGYERYTGPIPDGCLAVYRLDGVQYGHHQTQITGAELRARHGIDPQNHLQQDYGSEVRNADTLYLYGIERKFITFPAAHA
jgi:hypothetical protein